VPIRRGVGAWIVQSKRELGERGRLWAKILAEGVNPSRAALARGEGASRAAVTLALRRLT
jgi:hypothetical protein